MTAHELKPCPFCGGSDIRFDLHKNAGRGEHNGDDVWTMCCVDCGAKVPNRYNDHGKILMVSAWNTRADLVAAPDTRVVTVAQLERWATTPPRAFRSYKEIRAVIGGQANE